MKTKEVLCRRCGHIFHNRRLRELDQRDLKPIPCSLTPAAPRREHPNRSKAVLQFVQNNFQLTPTGAGLSISSPTLGGLTTALGKAMHGEERTNCTAPYSSRSSPLSTSRAAAPTLSTKQQPPIQTGLASGRSSVGSSFATAALSPANPSHNLHVYPPTYADGESSSSSLLPSYHPRRHPHFDLSVHSAGRSGLAGDLPFDAIYEEKRNELLRWESQLERKELHLQALQAALLRQEREMVSLMEAGLTDNQKFYSCYVKVFQQLRKLDEEASSAEQPAEAEDSDSD